MGGCVPPLRDARPGASEVRSAAGRRGCAALWRRDAAIVELFCGRGNGLQALEALGFANLEGVDLSPTLARAYCGRARVHVADCRALPFEDASRDVAIVHGGLHHLEHLEEYLQRTLEEVHRVLRPGGRLVVVEPWLTPFLSLVHAICALPRARAVSRRLDALAEMIESERPTYEAWLANPELVLRALNDLFETERRTIRFGKLALVALRRP